MISLSYSSCIALAIVIAGYSAIAFYLGRAVGSAKMRDDKDHEIAMIKLNHEVYARKEQR